MPEKLVKRVVFPQLPAIMADDPQAVQKIQSHLRQIALWSKSFERMLDQTFVANEATDRAGIEELTALEQKVDAIRELPNPKNLEDGTVVKVASGAWGVSQDATSGEGGGSSFTPTKTNLYNAIKEIFHPETNDGLTADDDNSQLDVASGAALSLQKIGEANFDLTVRNRWTHGADVINAPASVGADEIWLIFIVIGNASDAVIFDAATFYDLPATAVDGQDNIRTGGSRNAQGFTSGFSQFYLGRTSTRRICLSGLSTGSDPMPLKIFKLG